MTKIDHSKLTDRDQLISHDKLLKVKVYARREGGHGGDTVITTKRGLGFFGLFGSIDSTQRISDYERRVHEAQSMEAK